MLTRAALQLLGGVLALLVNNVAAAPIVDVFTFTTSNQSMWREGGSAIFSAETPLVSKWGTYDGSDAEDLKMGGIAGKENQKVAGTGIDIPNPAYEAWKVAYDACRELFSRNTCINGQSAKKTCVPFVGCATTRPKVSGLGDEPDHTIRVPSEFVDTRTGMETHLLTSGQVGIIPWVKAFGGSIKIELPVKTTFEMPDILTSGTPFTIKTGLTLENGARITAETPFLKAGVDGLINMTNTFTGTSCVIFAGCDSSSSTQNFNPGRFGLVGVDTTKDHPFQVFGDGKGTGSNPDFKDALGVPGLTLDVVHPWFFPSILNTDGVHDPLTPQIDLSKPRLGDVTVFTLDEQLSGGTLTGSKLELDTNQQVMSLNASVTGIGEMSVGSPGFLSKSFSISIPVFPDPKIVTTLLDVGIGPRFGLQQEFDFTPDAWVRLEFDRPVTRTSDGKVFDDGIVEFKLGTDVELRFDGGVGDLLRRTYFMKDSQFSNDTSATIDPGMKIEVGCFSLTVAEDYDCVFTEDYSTTGLLETPLYSRQWTLAGFNQFSVTADGGAAIPAPGTALLVALGLAIAGLTRSRKRRAGCLLK